METLNCDKDSALDFIARNVINGVHEQLTLTRRTYSPPAPQPKIKFVVPQHDIQPTRVMAYLIKTRGIDAGIVKDLIQQRMIAEDVNHHNCLFFGKDKEGVIRSCGLRSTMSNVQFRGEVGGGDKSTSFAMIGRSDTVRLFESPIDAMSHATFSKLLGKDWTLDSRLSTNGCGYDSVKRFLTDHPNINNVWICYDNDSGGARGIAGTQAAIKRDFPDRELTIRIAHPVSGKDWNEDLQNFRRAEQQGITAKYG